MDGARTVGDLDAGVGEPVARADHAASRERASAHDAAAVRERMSWEAYRLNRPEGLPAELEDPAAVLRLVGSA